MGIPATDWLHLLLAVVGPLCVLVMTILKGTIDRELKRHDEDRKEMKAALLALEERVTIHGHKQSAHEVLLQAHSVLLGDHSTKVQASEARKVIEETWERRFVTIEKEIFDIRKRLHDIGNTLNGVALLVDFLSKKEKE